jgi:hypothetical protein
MLLFRRNIRTEAFRNGHNDSIYRINVDMKIKEIFICLLLFCVNTLHANDYNRRIKWDDENVNRLNFFGAIVHENQRNIPFYFEKIKLNNNVEQIELYIVNAVFEQIPDSLISPELVSVVKEEIIFNSKIVFERKKTFVQFSFIPVKASFETGIFYRLISFDLKIKELNSAKNLLKNIKSAKNSVLSTGNWYKIKVQKNGIYKIDYAKLQKLGIDPTQVDPRKIRIYGNEGGMLSENNSENRADDLIENAIIVIGEEDGHFNADDYILFYGQSPHQWNYNESSKEFNHQYNVYADYSYYFINTDKGLGKRIQSQVSSPKTPSQTVVDFQDNKFHEADDRNLVNSGRTWYGEVFDLQLTHTFDFSFPDIITSKKVRIEVDVAARSSNNSSFEIKEKTSLIGILPVSKINFSNSFPPYAKTINRTFSFYTNNDNLNLHLSYLKPNNSSVGWLNYIEISAWRSLIYRGGQMVFQNSAYLNTSDVLKFELENRSVIEHLWDVSDPTNVKAQAYSTNKNLISFTQDDNDLHEYLVADNNSYLIPEVVGTVVNQNYHGLNVADLIIISSPEFFSEAIRLGNFHLQRDGLSYCLVEPQKIYNEFSSGAQDISAIRDFVKYLYDKAEEGKEPRYLLLFGDASFDYKDRLEKNTNIVPTWESANAVDIRNSFMSDDFFGLLDENEGSNLNGALDIGIGRLPVSSFDEARIVVDKILHYAGNNPEVMGRWRNEVCFVGDDQDYNAYITDSELIANQLSEICPNAHINKIYFDAYPQVSTPGGKRYPAATKAINQTVQDGALLVNYIGHGGETGWAHERVLELSDINKWSNSNNLPIFITATCEFTRLDDPERKSAGEYIMTNANGGGIALYTTTRATSSGGNFQLNKSVINYLFKDTGADCCRLGDAVLGAKNAIGNTINGQKFVLIGDPALKIAIPKDSLAVLKVNNIVVDLIPDTLKALAQITISGSVFDLNKTKNINFNGLLSAIVYDKESKLKTLAQDPNSFEYEFGLMNNVLYKGEATIVNGDFSFSFVVPKDIAYNYDFGKISLYAQSDNSDAWGSYNNVIIGGYNDQADNDISGPVIRLYMNNEKFLSGDQISKNPKLIAYISDENGINTVGTGIGHDIVAILDEITNNPYVLNKFYESNLDTYTNGKVEYQFFDLKNGIHKLEVRAWDVYNNSSNATIEFLVAESEELLITSLQNFPNPFYNETTFKFLINKDYSNVDIEIQIFNLNGQKVKTIIDSNTNNLFVNWKGETDEGQKLEAGLYVYRLLVRLKDGTIAERKEKFLIIK